VPQRLEFIIFNLLKNSLYYLKIFPAAELTLGCEKIEKNGQKFNSIFVADTGPGIPKEILSNLFQDFFTAGKQGGTGLGLSFCKKNMRIFGGDIFCESRFGEGKQGFTKFSLAFPALEPKQKQNSQQKSSGSEQHPNFQKSGKNVDLRQLQNRKVILADDQPVNRLLFKRALEKEGLVVLEAENGEELLKLYQKSLDKNGDCDLDLIITDLDMPKLGGYEAIKKLREIEASFQGTKSNRKSIPVIVVSGDDSEPKFDETLISGYFLKGESMKKLIELVGSKVAI